MITLYQYQQDIINKIRHKWNTGKRRIIVQSPTGSGKTVIFSWIAQQMQAKQKRILIITNREELLKETGNTLEEFGIRPAIVSAGVSRVPVEALVTVSMTATLRNRMTKWEWLIWFNTIDLIIIDEAHMQDYEHIFQHCKDKYILGFTATPRRRGGQQQLSEQYETIVSGLDVQQLINAGYLVKDRYFGVPVDLTGVGRDSFGEYKTDEMFSRYDCVELYAGVVSNWQQIAHGTITLIFCVNIQHCIETCRAFNQAGIKAKFVTSSVEVPDLNAIERKKREYENYRRAYLQWSGERSEVIDSWKRGEYAVLINAGILTTGFNFKPIQTVVVNRATTSENLWLQMIGRGSRTAPGKTEFTILDFGENASRLGHYRQQREYSLSHFRVKRNDGVQSIKECRQCGALVIASSKTCKYCGYEFPKSKEEKQVELIEHTFSDKKAGEAISELRTIRDVELAAELRKYSAKWVWRQVFFKFGKEKFIEYMRARGYQYNFIYRQIGQYGKV